MNEQLSEELREKIRSDADRLIAAFYDSEERKEWPAWATEAVLNMEELLTVLATQPQAPQGAVNQWIGVYDSRPPLKSENDDVEVWTWDGATVQEDEYGGIFEQPAGPTVGGWVCVGYGFAGDGISRQATHWMLRSKPAAPETPEGAKP